MFLMNILDLDVGCVITRECFNVHKTVIYNGKSGPFKCEVVVKVCAKNSQACMGACV